MENNSNLDPQSDQPHNDSQPEVTGPQDGPVDHSPASEPAASESADSPAVEQADQVMGAATELVAEVTSAVEVQDKEPAEHAGEEVLDLDDPKSIELSAEFVGRWSTLISTTNWEKGRIIAEWRDALMGSEAPPAAYSDEAWSRRVGGVSPQHVGRLRRVSERFAETFSTYEGIYWSHFLAALDWDDAEMWLEGAVQSKWSVSQMRRTRWEAMGGKPEDKPAPADVQAASMDEDYEPLSEVGGDGDSEIGGSTREVAEGPRPDGPDFGDEDEFSAAAKEKSGDADEDVAWEEASGDDETPFARLPSLPVDLAEAVEQFKLAIIRHRADQWSEVSKDDIVKALEALKSFTNL